MDKSSIIKSAKGHEEEKVGFSLKLPKNLKDQLQEVSEKESVSMNALIVATLQAMINDECGKELKQAKNLLLDYRKIVAEQALYFERYQPSQDQEFEADQILDKLAQINYILGV